MKFRLAFSMIELVLVIVVIGILASLAIPRMDRDLRQEAIDSVVANIRLTQRMALSDHRHDINQTWQRSYWQWRLSTCDNGSYYYSVFSDNNRDGDIDVGEIAIDPYNRKYLHAREDGYCTSGDANNTDSDRVLLSKKFGITSIARVGGCANNAHIAFDEFGRPHNGIDGYASPNFAFLMREDCNLTFVLGESNFTVNIEAITGRVSEL